MPSDHTRLDDGLGAPDPSRASLWAGSLTACFPEVAVDRAVDVVVVGAGITGLLTAMLLARGGADVLVLDRNEIGGVATRNTTAKVTALQGTVYRDISSSRGPEVAAAYAAAELDAVRGIRRLAGELDVDCRLTEAPAVTYGTESETVGRLREEHDEARAAGLPVQWVTETELPFPVAGAIRLDGQLHFDPGAFCDAVATSLGPDHVAEHSVVREVREDRDGCQVVLESGVTVSAANVVIATQGPVVDPAFLANRCTPMQSYVLAARLRADVPAGMYLSCDRSVRSLRPAVVGGETLAVVGGEGHHMGDDDVWPARWDALESWATEHFGVAAVTHRWATHDLVPTDHVPFIGRLGPTTRRRWVATGFAKWGMTNGYVAARLLTEAIGGRSVSWASAFDATRIASTLNPGMVSIGITATRHLVIDRIARRAAPRCTHQGCVLRRDEALGTWDCACHGSRFLADGSVIQGPATAPLND